MSLLITSARPDSENSLKTGRVITILGKGTEFR